MADVWTWWVAVWGAGTVEAVLMAALAVWLYVGLSGLAALYVAGWDNRTWTEPRDWVAGALWPVWAPVRFLVWGAYVVGPFTSGAASALGWGTVAALRLLAGREPGGRP